MPVRRPWYGKDRGRQFENFGYLIPIPDETSQPKKPHKMMEAKGEEDSHPGPESQQACAALARLVRSTNNAGNSGGEGGVESELAPSAAGAHAACRKAAATATAADKAAHAAIVAARQELDTELIRLMRLQPRLTELRRCCWNPPRARELDLRRIIAQMISAPGSTACKGHPLPRYAREPLFALCRQPTHPSAGCTGMRDRQGRTGRCMD